MRLYKTSNAKKRYFIGSVLPQQVWPLSRNFLLQGGDGKSWQSKTPNAASVTRGTLKLLAYCPDRRLLISWITIFLHMHIHVYALNPKNKKKVSVVMHFK